MRIILELRLKCLRITTEISRVFSTIRKIPGTIIARLFKNQANDQVIITGFFTENGTYRDDATVLRESLSAFKIPSDLVEMKSRGSWLANTGMKAEVVLGFINKYWGGAIINMDVDSIVLQNPFHYFEKIQSDIAAVMFDGVLLSGVVFFRCNEKVKKTVIRWIELLQKNPTEWDQRLLLQAIRDTDVSFEPLPPAYNYMIGLSQKKYPDIQPIIIATRAALRPSNGDSG